MAAKSDRALRVLFGLYAGIQEVQQDFPWETPCYLLEVEIIKGNSGEKKKKKKKKCGNIYNNTIQSY